MRQLLPIAVVVFALTHCSGSTAEWRAEKRGLSQTSYRKASGSFGGLLVLTSNANAFIEQWRNKPVDATPVIETASRLKRGETLNAFVIFSGCDAGADGKCIATVDYRLIAPNGTVMATRDGLVLSDEVPPRTGLLQLAPPSLVVRIETSDPVGQYRVRATLHDLVSHRNLALDQVFAVE